MQKQFDITPLGDQCRLCGGSTRKVLDLIDLPFTGVYGKYEPAWNDWKIDQALNLCFACGHGQLKNMLDLSFLYGDTYSFRTSSSKTSSAAAHAFRRQIETWFPGKHFSRIMEFGCNDGYLLELLKPLADRLLGIDLIWKGRENEFIDDKIEVTGDPVEQSDVSRLMQGVPDLIVSQHTMEHIPDPVTLMGSLFRLADSNTVFCFEFPCFDLLLERARIDQVFHEHLQYYSIHSFFSLLDRMGFEILDFTFNRHHWGAVIVAFRKKTGTGSHRVTGLRLNRFAKIEPDRLLTVISEFSGQMASVRQALDRLSGIPVWGYGAALMLPVLGYHLKTDFSGFEAVLDDDPAKHNSGYLNLPVTIVKPDAFDFSRAVIVLTALDNRRPILKRLLSEQVKEIINPIQFI
jgi:hypothetical protein